MNSAWPAIEAEWDRAVGDFLRTNPDWLARHPDVYRALTPPARVHGDAMADHMAAMLHQERMHADAMTVQQQAILAAGRATASALARVQDAVLALMAAPNAVDFVLTELPRLMDGDAACLAARPQRPNMNASEATRLDSILGQRDVVYRARPADAAILYGEAAPLALNDMLLRLPGVGVLGIASRSPFEPSSQAQGSLRFLGRAVAVALLR